MNSKANKEILVVCPGDPAKDEVGAVVHSKRIYTILKEHFQAHLFGFEQSSPFLSRAEFLHLLCRWFFSFVRAIIARLRIHCVYIVYEPRCFFIAVFLKKMGLGKFKIVYHAGGLPWAETKNKFTLFRRALNVFIALCADYVVVHSSMTKVFYGSYTKKVHLVPTFVDTNEFKRNNLKGIAIRQKYGFSVKNKIVGIIGPFDPYYNISSLQFLRTHIDEFDQRIKFLAIGICSPTDEVKDARVIHTGYVQDYVGYLSALDCVIVPRRIFTEGALNKVVEAMAVGLPVFVTPVAVASMSNIIPSFNILVFEEDEMVGAVNQLLFDEELMQRIGESARFMIQKYYSQEIIKMGLIHLIEDISK